MARIYQRGSIWYLDVAYQGRRVRKRVGTSKRMAELALKDAEVKVVKKEFGFSYNKRLPHDALGDLPPTTFREQQTVRNSSYELST